MKNKITLSPSVMCADLVNLENSIRELETLGLDTLHIDIIDGSFSPSMPLGIDTVKRLREITDMKFDVHIMSKNNEYYIKEMLDIGVQQISFHLETTLHADRLIKLIKDAGVKVGVALNPASGINNLDYILPQIDTLVLMLINPGFATAKGENQVDYAVKKIKDARRLLTDYSNVQIQIDGRVSLETIPGLVSAGADNLVLGSTGLFIKGQSLDDSYKILQEKIKEGESNVDL